MPTKCKLVGAGVVEAIKQPIRTRRDFASLRRQHRRKLRLWHRTGKEEALSDVAAHLMQRLEFGLGLDPFRYRLGSKPVSEVDHGLADALVGRIEVAQFRTKLRSSLSSQNGSSRSRAKDE